MANRLFVGKIKKKEGIRLKILEFFANLSTVAQVFLAFFCVLVFATILFFVYKITGRDKTAQRIGKIIIQKFLGVDDSRDDYESIDAKRSEDTEDEKKNDETNQTSI